VISRGNADAEVKIWRQAASKLWCLWPKLQMAWCLSSPTRI
jgi:hypothetical protein